MYTMSGISFNPFDLKLENTNIEDVAHSLSNLCRFGGHTSSFYSVAQHCVLVSNVIDFRYAYEGLMHDASEAYIIDLPRPIKKEMDDYVELENHVQSVLSERFNFKYPFPHQVKLADNIAFALEVERFMPEESNYSGFDGINVTEEVLVDAKERIHGRYIFRTGDLESWTPEEAKSQFLKRFKKLHTKRMLYGR